MTMTENVQWIKLNIDMFDWWQIKELRDLPEGDTIVVIWIKLLTMACKSNKGGMLMFNEHIPITTKSIASQLNVRQSTVELAIQALMKMEMITDIDGVLQIVDWNQYSDPVEAIRQQNKERQKRFRDKRKLPLLETKEATGQLELSRFMNQPEEQETVIKAEKREDDVPRDAVKRVVEAWNDMCQKTGLKSISRMVASSKRYTSLKARLKEYGLDDMLKAIEMIPDCTYILDKGWFNFDWFVRPSNFPKVLEGNYIDPAKKKRLLEAKAKPVAAEEPKEMTDEEWLEMMRNS